MMMKRGGIIVAMTESHAVPQRVTQELVDDFTFKSKAPMSHRDDDYPNHHNIHVYHIPRLSNMNWNI
jgi:hypothetical protein